MNYPKLNLGDYDSFDRAYGQLEHRLIGGWMHKSECEWLYQQARESKRILEIGCFKGRSTFMLCCGTSGTVFSVDHFQGPFEGGHHGGELATEQGRLEVIDSIKLKLAEFFEAGRLFLLECKSSYAMLHVLPTLMQHTTGFDFIFIDGAHDYQSVCRDIRWAKSYLAPDGVISGHDYKPNEFGVKQAVDESFPKHRRGPGSIWFVSPKE